MGNMRVLYIDVLLMVLSSCSFSFDTPIRGITEYIVELPDIPLGWSSTLGSPAWRLQWLDKYDLFTTLEVSPGVQELTVPLSIHHPGPIWAWPYWPQHGIEPYRTKPAGAILPLDIRGNRCRLTWMGGVDAVFFEYLEHNSGSSRYSPQRFNWPRFRSLFSEGKLSPEVQKDPWCVNWLLVAQETGHSGFDSRRLVPRPTKVLPIILPHPGPWVSGSPFLQDVYQNQEADGGVLSIPASSAVDTILSTHGILSYSWDGVVFIPGLKDP